MLVQLNKTKEILSDKYLIKRILDLTQLLVMSVILCWVLSLSFNSINAQVIDEWRVYSSFSTVNDIIVTDQNYRFVATQGGLVITDPVGISSTLTTMDGLHRLDIQKLAYHSPSKQLFLGYMDGFRRLFDRLGWYLDDLG